MATKSYQQSRHVTLDDLPVIAPGIFGYNDGVPVYAPGNGELWAVLRNDAINKAIILDRDGKLYRTK
jgi:hypothetical protein